MTIGLTTEAGFPKSFKSIRSPVVQKTPYARQRPRSLVAWVALIGILFPPIDISLGAIHVTPGRVVVILLLVPALGTLLRSGRSGVASDLFAVAVSTWMLVSSALNGGFRLFVGAEALEFLGAYLIGRAFFFGPSNLQTFVQALKGITVVIIALGILDTLSGRNITIESLGIARPISDLYLASSYRMGLVRSTSLFECAEHYGAFCAAAASIFFYAERGISRIIYVGLCFFGCVFALSSGPLMILCIVTAVFSYDHILKHYPWRWKALMTTVIGLIAIIFLVTDHPVMWILSHVTFDPQTAWFRLGTWNTALPLVEQSPVIGYGFSSLGDSDAVRVYLWSVDSLWLIEALRYGLSGVILLTLTMVLAILKRRRKSTFDLGIYAAPTGFSLAIVAMGLIGLTVHFWDAPWLFLSVSIGIRASLGEYEAGQGRRLARGGKGLPLQRSAPLTAERLQVGN